MKRSNSQTEKPVAHVVDGDSGVTEAYAFRFVEVGEPSQTRDEDARTLIRSHLVKDLYERKDRLKQSVRLPEVSNTTVTRDAVAQQMHRFKVGPEGLREVKKRKKKAENPEEQSWSRKECEKVGVGVEFRTRAATVRAQKQSGTGDPSSDESHLAAGAGIARPGASVFSNLSRAQNSIHRPEYPPAGAGPIDPFNTLPEINHPRTQILLYHANRGILSLRLMGQLRTEWLSLATQDAAFFYVASSHYAGNYSLLDKENDPTEAVRFKMESMKLVNRRMDHIDPALSDGTLGTVASLSSYEATNGSLSAIRTHMRGLQKLVELRGGLKDPKMNPYTRWLILWADLNCASALGTDAIFPLLDSHDIALTGEQPRLVNHAVNHDPLEVKTNSRTLRTELQQTFSALKCLADINRKEGGATRSTKIRQIQDSDELHFVERSLQRLSNLCGPHKFLTSGCIAAIIFLDNQLRGIQLNAKLMDRFVARLRFSMQMILEDISRHDSRERASSAIFWVLFVGAVASGVRPEGDWFLRRLCELSYQLALPSWDDALSILRAFLWAEDWNSLGRFLWIEIDEKRRMKAAIDSVMMGADDVDIGNGPPFSVEGLEWFEEEFVEEC